MKAHNKKNCFARSAIALAVAAVLQSAPALAQQATVINPENGAEEVVVAVLDNPAFSVRTAAGNIIWVGPTTIGQTFFLPYRAGEPAQYGAPAIPERPAGTYRISARNPQTGLATSVSYELAVTSPPPATTFDVVTYIGDLGVEGDDGIGAGGVDPATLPPSTGTDVTHFPPMREHGDYGYNGDDGWGVEICIIDCWTIGESAEGGGPGGQGDPLTPTIGGPAISIESPGIHGIWVSSRGGDGGQGGDAYGILPAARGGTAGRGGNVTVTVNTNVTTTGADSYGVFAQSRAGTSGAGGNGYGISTPGSGGAPAVGGDAILINNGNIETWGEGSIGLYVQSLGGGGGASGDSYGIVGLPGSGSEGGNGGMATAENHGTVETHGINAHGIFAQSVGGRGGDAGTSGGIVGLAGNGRSGGEGRAVSVTNDGSVLTRNHYAHGIVAQSLGGGGGNGGDSGGVGAIGGEGSSGGRGGAVYVNNDWVSALRFGQIETLGINSHGILAESVGGGGGNGGSSGGFVGIGGTGTGGGAGDQVRVFNDGSIITRGRYSSGILAHSIGGGGGAGGNGDGLVGIGGDSVTAGPPSNGGEVLVENQVHGTIHTFGRDANGILAQSIGGGGGAGAGAGGIGAIGGQGASGGDGTHVRVTNDGQILTELRDSRGIVAQSIGGGGGSASNSGGAVEIGGAGGGGGNGGYVEVYNHNLISTVGIGSDGVFAQSIGGGGGNGASTDGAVAIGGSGSGGGNGGAVRVDNTGTIATLGMRARGVMAESIGGGGGSGGDGDGLVSIGGSGGPGGASATPDNAGRVDLNNSGLITTHGNQSSAIEARSVGGGGGNGGSTGGAFLTIGGRGGDGGAGGEVHIDNDRNLTTDGNDSHGVYAQSIGGGGGNGGSAISLSAFAGVAVGGDGGNASNGATVIISGGLDSTPAHLPLAVTPVIQTHGDRAKGVFAQSVGGGGGNGGFAVQATVGYGVGTSAAVGGAGGGGGNGALVTIEGRQNIATGGVDADGLLAQSIGGGGGNGGFAISFAGGAGDVGSGAISATVGGRGGVGGTGGHVDVRSGGNIQTTGDQSEGLIAQSIGGGGGTGGFTISVAAAVAGGGSGAVAASIGGAGGAGGLSDRVDVNYTGNISTAGDDSTGVVSQSVGGGGGNGGFAIAGALSGAGAAAGSVAVGIGGNGGGAGAGGVVASTINGNVTTGGERSSGLLAQSVGGSGGNGGFSVAGSVAGAGSSAGAVSVGIGGAAGGGGNASNASATLNGDGITMGTDSDAVVVQSIGGGGGNGGFSVSGSMAGSGSTSAAISVGIGGAGGAAGNGARATGIVNGNLATSGDGANGLVAQSVGGGGGNGGFTVAAGISASGALAGAAAVGFGGSGGGGGSGGIVDARLTGSAHTSGDNATAIVAQSLGGGGGNGGFTTSDVLAASGSTAASVAVGFGGSGGTGGSSNQTTLTVVGDTLTEGNNAGGVLAQSVGGGGGNGGFNVSGAVSGTGGNGGAVAVGFGGSGGSGANVGGAVVADITGNIVTLGNNSTGITSQSIGGGGGNGGFNVSGTISAAGGNSAAVSIGLGGSGGVGGSGASATGILRGNLQTVGHDSDGVLVQSIGGGGGNGGFNVTGSIAASGGNAGSIAVGLGGSGGGAGHGGAATATVTGNVMTSGDNASSIIAQSVGGGGGNGGFNVTGSVSGAGGSAVGVAVGLGGAGGGGGNGGIVSATVTGDASTQGDNATAVIVQSLGGGGGAGGMNVTANVSGSGSGAGGVTVGLGGAGGGGGDAALTTLVLTGDVETQGDDASGILVQSVGGGGGAGGMNVSANVTGSGQGAGALSVGLGGSGGLGGDGAIVSSTVTGDVRTQGDRATGYVAQSLGGGGGNGALNVTGTLVASGSGAGSVSIGLGGAGGGGGDGRAVTASLTGNLTTLGDDAYGALFQSVGGGGGNGGMNISSAVSAGNNGAGALAIGVGGSGGGGGDSAAVIGAVTGNTATAGDRSFGVLMQSVGGGGGNGGMNISAAVSLSKGPGGAIGIGVGGFGGDGGDASTVTGTVSGAVLTTGTASTGVLAQSVGGGGGNGGMNISGAVSIAKDSTAAAAMGVGGFGGGPGDGRLVTLTRTGATTTTGANSDGVVAQSIGGGGGNGGMNISGALSGSTSGTAFSAALGLGGFGGGGGNGGNVISTVTGDVSATGHSAVTYFVEDSLLRRAITNGSNGVLAQSVGGSGGNGGINISGGIALASPSQGHSYGLTLGVGGFGGAGGDAGTVRLDVTANNVASFGDQRFGVGAQSIGGGGGNGGMNVSGGVVMDGQMVGGVGGFGGLGGEGRLVNATATTDISAVGTGAIGFLAQSIGGGGGNGGMNVSGGIQASRQAQTPSLVFGVGGFGGAGNVSGDVIATQRGNIEVSGGDSFGVLAQSIAGGGGNGALNVSGNAGLTRGYNAALGVGGQGGTGADAGTVTLTSNGNIAVDGSDIGDISDPNYSPGEFDLVGMSFRERTNGVLAQSIGGGGGNGGMNVSGVGAINGNPITAGVGGSGSTGGNGGAVSVTRGLIASGTLSTYGNNANGLTAQSIGGGGGNGGMNFLFSNTGAATPSRPVTAVMLGVGGSGAAAGNGNTVDVEHVGVITTEGDFSNGVVAQSVGGGGGSATFNIGLGNNPDAKAFNVALGGGTGDGGYGDSVDVVHTGEIRTEGDVSNAIFAQSVGGGGGSTGMDMVTSPRSASGIDIGIGRSGGTGGTGGNVSVDSTGVLLTEGDRSNGIRAQSVGNGGGDSSSSSIEFSGEGDGEGQDWSASMEVGIDGGLGGEAGDVEVHAAGGIRTQGIAAHGIYAQSVGGGGGAGGALERHGIMEASNQVSIGVGGNGGIGGVSGVVSVDNDAIIETTGDDSHGVFAQSIAGGGGLGGYIAQMDHSIGGGSGGANFSVQMGGTGGEGAAADEVTVNNTGSIQTSGRRSYGIDAQSVGGGGGEGGAIVSAAVTRGSNSRNVSMNLGGSGGDGGTGDAVTVTNEGRIDTTGDDSVGIRAQSVGGKGGDAGLMLELGIVALTNNQEATNVSIKVGGDGGTGASSGDVEVTNRAVEGDDGTGIVTTSGRAAHGIFAQSLGGGGGNGSSIITSNLGASSQGQATLVNLSVGGSGGEGGTAGDVTVTNESLIETQGEEAHGVFAQSIGGGGGNGGLVIAANAVLAQGDVANEAMIALGGAGGDGDDAGDVTVDNSGRIVTHGARSHGIFAQSIGGGGGNAGVGFGASTNPGSTVIAGVMSATFGGDSGEGGLGGQVTVNHSGNITVFGENSQAVVAESINGGGGHLALDFRGVTSLPGLPSQIFNGIPLPDGTDSAPVIVFKGGGVNQQNSDAGRVTLNYTGTFGVAGNNGAANAVQAIGGGGGTFDLNLGLNDMVGNADDVEIEGRLGGVDGTNNRGGDIESAHDGDLVTEGDNTPGALVQSIGGGGGRANLALSSRYDSIGATDLTLGGENGNNEEGGDIEHSQSGSVFTSGVSAHGGVFQSVGGGGGAVSVLADNGETAAAGKAARRENLKIGASREVRMQALLVPSMTFGSSGGTTLSGGDVTLALDGNVETEGDNSIGMIFQSVGAGGGIANVLGVDGLSVSLGGSNGASGDGGALEVANTGDVMTTGLRSHGVFLQSIGGGGSAVFTDAAAPTVALSTDNTGNGGDITFVQNGTIATSGDHAYSLFAQSVGGGGGYVDGSFAASAGGAGTAGAIDLALNGDIAALGDFSTALFAQSTGANGLGGNITANLSAGNQLVGGLNGVAVYFDGGAVNRFANYGTVRTLSGPQGFAFRGGAGGDLVDNHGIVMGNVDLATGVNRFANNIDGTFYSGTTVNLGDAANILRNDGLIAPGAGNLAVHTRLSGSFVQSATGTSDLEIDFAMRDGDRITATGTATVGGRINVSLLNVQNILPGMTFQPLYIASGGANASGIAFNPQESIVIDYRLANQSANVLGVEYEVDFAAEGLSGNRVQIGEYLNRVQLRGGPSGLGDTITAAVLETSLDDYAFMLTQLGTEFYTEQQSLALNDVQRFSRNLQNCGASAIGGSDGDTGCYWFRYDDNPSTRQTQAGFPAAESQSYSFSQGLQIPRDGWSLGFALDYADYRSSGFDGLWTSDSEFFQLGASVRRDLWGGSVGATLQLGHNSETVSRLLGVTDPVEARGHRSVLFLSDVLDYTYDYTTGGFSLQPSLSLGTSFLNYGDMTEQGAQAQNAVIYGGSETHLWVEPAIGGRYVVNFGNGSSLRTFARVGVLQYLSGTSTKVRAGLEGAPLAADPMRIGSDLDRTHVVGEAGLQYEGSDGFTLGFSYTHQESDIREGGAGSLRFVLPLK